MRRGLARFVVVLAGLIVSGGCSKRPTTAPPEILFGQDTCDVCGMIISADRFAAALVLEDGEGRYEPRAYDDIGCLLGAAAAGAGRVAARYVAFFTSRQWCAAGQATYVHSAKLRSPMAFGLAACDSADDARSVQEQYGGQVLDFAAVRQRFDAGELVIRDAGGEGES